MAIAWDASSNGGTFVSSWAHTVGSGSDRLLVVTAFDDTGGSNLLTAVKWNTSESFTKAGQIQCPSDRWTSLWYLLNPTSGTFNIVLTTTAGAMAGLGASYTGVGALDGTPATEASTSVNHSTTITVAANSWIITGTKSGNTVAETWTNAAERINGGNGTHLADSNGALSAGSQVTTQTQNGVTSYASGMVSAAFTVAGAGGGRGLFRTPSLSGAGIGGSFFRDPLQAREQMVKRNHIYVPERYAA